MGYKVQSTRRLSSSRLNTKNLRVLPLYLVSPNTTSITEGNTVTFTISAFNVDNGTTLYWNNSGTAIAADFTGAVNSGSFTVTNQTATVTLTLVSADLPEGIETIIFEVRTGSTSGAILVTAATVSIFDAAATFAISPSTSSVTEGNSVTYTVTTTNVANGTLYWTNSGTTVAADFSDAANSGSFTVTNGSGTITRTLANNTTFEGTETIILEVRTGGTSGTIVATSSTVNVTDAAATYSVSPSTSSVNEGSSVTWTVTTTNVADSTTLYWTNSGTTVAGDFTSGANSGSFTVTSNTGSFSLTLSNDLTTEGSETIVIQIRTGSTSGTIVATASTVTVNDTSIQITDPNYSSVTLHLQGIGSNGAQNNTFLDSSGNNYTITRFGNATQGRFSPFSQSAVYNATSHGGSAHFDGSGDYIGTTTNTVVGTGDFTLDWWIYHIDAGNPCWLWDGWFNSGNGPQIFITSSGTLFRYQPYDVPIINLTIANRVNQWVYYRICRSSSTVRLFINGVYQAQATDSRNYSTTFRGGFGARARDGAEGNRAYFSSFRATTSALSTTNTNFSVPTAPFTAITNTILLLNFTNAGIYDSSSKTNLETVGNAQISTATAKWGSSSISFDGTGDWLLVPDLPSQRIGTGNFTVEMWVYRNSSGTYGLVGKGTSTTGWLVSLNSSNQVVFTNGTSTITSTGTVSATTWTHIAVVREGTGANQTKIYINGTNDGTGTVSTDFNQTNAMYIGADRTGGSATNAYVQDVRITTLARYTANFTAPAGAFPTWT